MSEFSNPHISHIITVMFENRSFDNVLGYLYDQDDLPQHHIPPKKPKDSPFYGLNFTDDEDLTNWANIGGLLISQPPDSAIRATNIPGFDPGETYSHVNQQLFGNPTGPAKPGDVPDMSGFLADYAGQVATHTTNIDYDTVRQIMGNYRPADLPVTNTLAKKFAVCDEWFCSVPSQTNTNRAFSLAGTSCGLVDNGFFSTPGVPRFLGDDKFQTPTLFNVLSENDFDDWGIFWFEVYPPFIPGNEHCCTRNLFPYFEAIPNVDDHFHRYYDPIDGFDRQVKDGTLPRFSYIEPSWGAEMDAGGMSVVIMGTDLHPPCDVRPGEHLLLSIYNSIFAEDSPIADTALLVVLYDEHGGTYDHIPPGPALPPWGDGPPPPGITLEQGFEFDRYGVRTPAIMISKGIREGTVFRSPTSVPFDHTSLPATILSHFLPKLDKEDWGLGERVKQAPTFHEIVTGDRDQSRRNASNAFATDVTAAMGDPVNYGDPISLKHSDGRYVSFTVHQNQYFPTVGPSSVTLGFHNEVGRVCNGDQLQIRTTEYLMPETMVSFANVFPGTRNCLGTFLDKSLYYDTPVDTDAEKLARQAWMIKAEENGKKELSFGDHIKLESLFPDSNGQKMCEKDNSLTLGDADDIWQIVPGIPFQHALLDRIESGQPVSVAANIFVNIAVAADLASFEELTQFVSSAGKAMRKKDGWKSSKNGLILTTSGGHIKIENVSKKPDQAKVIKLIAKTFNMMRDSSPFVRTDLTVRIVIEPAIKTFEVDDPDGFPSGARVTFSL